MLLTSLIHRFTSKKLFFEKCQIFNFLLLVRISKINLCWGDSQFFKGFNTLFMSFIFTVLLIIMHNNFKKIYECTLYYKWMINKTSYGQLVILFKARDALNTTKLINKVRITLQMRHPGQNNNHKMILISCNNLDLLQIFALTKHSLLLIKQFCKLTSSACIPPRLLIEL
jgi:hypothetical protein